LLLKEYLNLFFMFVPSLGMLRIIFNASLLSSLLQLDWETQRLRLHILGAPYLGVMAAFYCFIH
jgi:hypothetical protein